MKKLLVFLGVVLTAIGSAGWAQEVDSTATLQKSSWGDAQENEVTDLIPEISLDMRGGYEQDFTEGTGRFFGDGLYLDINGTIGRGFSYSVNHRIASSYYEDNAGFNGTNWLTLTYEIGDFAFTAGKDGLLVGSFEYDEYDLDAYGTMNSMFYNMLDCWQWGVYGTWYPADDHEVSIQVANSPFSYGEPNLFAYAAAWRGEMDDYESYWTVNLWQTAPGRYVKSVNLGNRLSFDDFTVDLEYMTRGTDMKKLFTKDFTVMAAPSYEIEDRLRIFGKFGWERTEDEPEYELAYEECFGSDYLFYGAGLEFFPLKDNQDIRLHATWSGNNFGGNRFDIGLTWKMNLTRIFTRLIR